MKKIILFASVALGLGLASCVKDQVKESSSNGTSAGVPITVTAIAGSDDGTRTTVNGLNVTWAAGDTIRVWDGTPTGAIPFNPNASHIGSALFTITGSTGGTTASFTGTLPQGNGAVATRTLYATYGRILGSTVSMTASSSTNAVPFDLPNPQTQSGADVDGQYLYMWADPVSINGVAPSAVTFKFQYLCSILDIPITGVPAGEKVANVDIYADAGTYTADSNGDPTKPFMTRMQVSRASASTNSGATPKLVFARVGTGTYYVNDISVDLPNSAVATDIVAHIAVVPRDVMKDATGALLNSALPDDGTTMRDLKITITTVDASNNPANTYVFEKDGTDTRFNPGTRYKLQYSGGDFDLTAQGAYVPPSLPTPPAGDATISGNSIQVFTPAGLAWLAATANITAYAGYTGYTITVMNPLNLADTSIPATWTPIGTNTMPFTGTFDGGNKAISGLSLNNAGDGQGLFGYAGKDGATTTIENVAITTGTTVVLASASPSAATNCGSLLGSGYKVAISGCTVTGNGTGTSAGTVVFNHGASGTGVLVGTLNNSTVTDCHVYNLASAQGTITTTFSQSLMIGAVNSTFGGTAGPVTISNCSVENSSYNATVAEPGFGGIVGFVQSVPATITNCQFKGGTITTTGAPANLTNGWGGIVGTINSNTATAGSLVSGCSSSGTMTVGPSPAGGICGVIMSASAIVNCSNKMTITATGSNVNNRAGGICGAIGNLNTGTGANSVPVSAVIMGCVNNANVTGGGTTAQAHGVCGGICGLNNKGMIVGCKQAGGTLTAQTSNGAPVASTNADVGGICGLNMGQISACAVTGGSLVVKAGTTNAAQFPQTANADVIANNGVMNAAYSAIPVGQAETCYYVASAITGVTVPASMTAAATASTPTAFINFSAANASDFASVWPASGNAGWGATEPNGWSATYAPAVPSMAAWAFPWSSLGSSPATYPTLPAESL